MSPSPPGVSVLSEPGTVEAMEPRDQLVALLTEQGDAAPLDDAALLVAACAENDVDVDAAKGMLDDLAASCPGYTLDHLVPHLFGPGRFRANTADYYDPKNSFLHHVVEARRGLPILLSVVWMEVGRRAGAFTAGVGLPGHFVVRVGTRGGVLVDPFAGGRLVSVED